MHNRLLTLAVWNRVAAGSTKLNYFMAVQIVNPETQYIMVRALQQYNMNEVPPWPGKDFEFAIKDKDSQGNPSESHLLEMEAAFALLGMLYNYTRLPGTYLTTSRFLKRSRSRLFPHPTPPSAWLEVHLESEDLDGWIWRMGESKPPPLCFGPCHVRRAANIG